MSAITRVFAHILIARSSIPAAEAEDCVSELSAAKSIQTSLEDEIQHVNLKFQELGKKIVKMRHPRTEDWIIVVTTIGQNPVVKLALNQERFLEMIDKLMSVDRSYLVKARSLSKDQEQFDIFLNEGWIEEHPNGKYFPSTRLLVEGEKHLTERYEGTLKKCLGCNKFVIFGRFCANDNCDARVHRRCDRPWRQQQGLDNDSCPKCNGKFEEPNNEEDVVHEDGEELGDD